MSELNRRDLLVRGTAAAAAAYALRGPASGLIPGTAHAQTPPADAWNHDPASPIGPLHWGDIDGFSVCGTGEHRSPVNIETAHVEAGHGPPLSLRYKRSELAINNTGHAIEVPIPAGVEDVLQRGGDRYQLTQYHFHALSEHTVNGRHADVRGHSVNNNATGDTAVVGVFDSFYAYDGSLTTPGCTENVRWSVLTDGGHVSRAAVSRFHRVISEFANYGGYASNNRPVQPPNGLVIELRRGGKRHH